jgi:hypothetical protein
MRRAKEHETGRHLVFVDVENMTGTACPDTWEVEEVEQRLRRVIPDLDDALCVVACNHRAAPAVAFGFRNGLRRWRSGTDGADLALIEELGDTRVVKRLERVTLCSGDNIFSKSIAGLGALRVDSTVISTVGRLSRRLQLAAKHVLLLGEPITGTSRSAAMARRAS